MNDFICQSIPCQPFSLHGTVATAQSYQFFIQVYLCSALVYVHTYIHRLYVDDLAKFTECIYQPDLYSLAAVPIDFILISSLQFDTIRRIAGFVK